MTEDHSRLFVAEFRREAALLAKGEEHRDTVAEVRLAQVKLELGNLYQNPLAGLASPVLQNMITEREAEKERLTTRLALTGKPRPTADILPHPVLLGKRGLKTRVTRLA
ncbi:hypothetical protein [Sphingomonas solaris]|uniref:hypothetical protein n=1 Tax=Alterirhizorhabdus solaris TaxID=2529389 RepID=UPI00139678F2|nr:hypothetical protein [Sphingomonas solaris]